MSVIARLATASCNPLPPQKKPKRSSRFDQSNRTSLDCLGGYRLHSGEPFGTELGLLASVVLAASSVPRAIRGKKPVPMMLSMLAVYGVYVFGPAAYENLNL
jgi:hypothetical protein